MYVTCMQRPYFQVGFKINFNFFRLANVLVNWDFRWERKLINCYVWFFLLIANIVTDANTANILSIKQLTDRAFGFNSTARYFVYFRHKIGTMVFGPIYVGLCVKSFKKESSFKMAGLLTGILHWYWYPNCLVSDVMFWVIQLLVPLA